MGGTPDWAQTKGARLVAVAVLVGALLAAVLALRSPAPVPGPPLARISPSARSSPSTATQVNFVVAVGDSYMAGIGASSEASAWVNVLGTETGWEVANYARAGTGYRAAVKTGGSAACGRAACRAFARMALRASKSEDPDLVLVSGGRNDVGVPPAAVRRAVDSFFDSVRREFPHARIAAVSPLWGSTTPPLQLTTIREDVIAAVGRVHGSFLDVGQPLAGHPEWVAPDGVNPNDKGHAAIARAVLIAARKAGLLTKG